MRNFARQVKPRPVSWVAQRTHRTPSHHPGKARRSSSCAASSGGLAIDSGWANNFGFPIQITQQLALPTVPYAGTDIAHGEGSQTKVLNRLDPRSQRFRSASVIISRPCAMSDMTRCCSTSQATRSVAGETPSLGLNWRGFGAGERVVLFATFGDVMEERGKIERGS